MCSYFVTIKENGLILKEKKLKQYEFFAAYRNFGSIKSLPPSEIDVDECWEDDDRTISEVESSACFKNSTSFISNYERFLTQFFINTYMAISKKRYLKSKSF